MIQPTSLFLKNVATFGIAFSKGYPWPDRGNVASAMSRITDGKAGRCQTNLALPLPCQGLQTPQAAGLTCLSRSRACNANKAKSDVTSAQSMPKEACPKFELLLIVRLDRNLVFQAVEKDEVATILERPLVVRSEPIDREAEVESDG